VEGDGLGLDLALLHVDLVAGEDNGDVLADTDQVTWCGLAEFCTALGSRKRTVPVGDVLVCDTRGDVKHDDTALAVDVVSIAETTELLLACSVPDVELDGAEVLRVLSVAVSRRKARLTYGGEAERVDFDTEGRNVLLLELSSQMALDKRGLQAVSLASIVLSWCRAGRGVPRLASSAGQPQWVRNSGPGGCVPFQFRRHRQARA
jgi:hypothetical protein